MLLSLRLSHSFPPVKQSADHLLLFGGGETRASVSNSPSLSTDVDELVSEGVLLRRIDKPSFLEPEFAPSNTARLEWSRSNLMQISYSPPVLRDGKSDGDYKSIEKVVR